MKAVVKAGRAMLWVSLKVSRPRSAGQERGAETANRPDLKNRDEHLYVECSEDWAFQSNTDCSAVAIAKMED